MAGEKILIVEDNKMNLMLITDLLEFAGYTVLQAMDAEDAVQSVKNEPPDLILMDIALPGMNGLSLTRLLKKNPITKNIPVIALTAYAMKGDKEKILAAGCVGHIVKPISVKNFAKIVAHYVEQCGCSKK